MRIRLLTEKIWAYLVYQSTVDSGLLDLAEGYVPEPVVNSVLLVGDYRGKDAHAEKFEDGPITVYADLQYLGEGEKDASGNITFGLGTKRLLNLVNIGLEAEQVLSNQIHEFANKVQTELEPILVAAQAGQANADLTGNVLRKVDDIEKHFWDKKR